VRAALVPEKSGRIKAIIPAPINADKKILFMSISPPPLMRTGQAEFPIIQLLLSVSASRAKLSRRFRVEGKCVVGGIFFSLRVIHDW
jgi:hypothetical protein